MKLTYTMVVLTPFLPYIAGAVGFGSGLLDNQKQNTERCP